MPMAQIRCTCNTDRVLAVCKILGVTSKLSAYKDSIDRRYISMQQEKLCFFLRLTYTTKTKQLKVPSITFVTSDTLCTFILMQVLVS